MQFRLFVYFIFLSKDEHINLDWIKYGSSSVNKWNFCMCPQDRAIVSYINYMYCTEDCRQKVCFFFNLMCKL